MSNTPKSIIIKNGSGQRVYSTFADWQTKQLLDLRTPAQRGIGIGSSVMWRYMQNSIIITSRAVVLAISGDMLKLQIKDVNNRTVDVNINEIVSNTEGHTTRTL